MPVPPAHSPVEQSPSEAPRPWSALRRVQIALVAGVALFTTIVTFGNVTDAGTNFEFVRHVLAMDTIFEDSAIDYRAITPEWMHVVAYALVIATEAAVSVLCWWGVVRLLKQRHAPSEQFRDAKGIAVAGLGLGCLLWLVGFLAIGGEWFGMWMSSVWNGTETASHLFVVFLGVLLLLVSRDD